MRRLCHLAKNIFNEANYLVRQAYFTTGTWTKAASLHSQLQNSSNFQAFPQPTTLKILTLVERAWKSFFAASADWQSHPEKYYRKPRPPKYKHKAGEFLLWFSKTQLECVDGRLRIPQLPYLQVKMRWASPQSVLGVRIVPQGVGYVFEIFYTKAVPVAPTTAPTRVVGIDLGLAKLITLVNNIGKSPIVVKGGVAKSMNKYYNKARETWNSPGQANQPEFCVYPLS